MARVPVPSPGSGVDVRPLTQNRLVVSDQTAGLRQTGEALERAGQFGFAYAEEQDRIDRALDMAAVRQRDNEDARFLRERLWTGDNAFYRQEGFDAANARGPLEEELRRRREEAAASFTTPRQRALYEQVAERRFGAELEGVARHVTTQVRAEERRQSVARITEASNDAVTNWDDPERREAAILTAIGELRSQADQSGWAPEVLRQAEAEARSNIVARGLRAMIDRGDIEGANSQLQTMREQLLPDAETQIDAALRGPMLDRESVSIADQILGMGPGAVVDGETEPAGGAAEPPAPGAGRASAPAAGAGASRPGRGSQGGAAPPRITARGAEGQLADALHAGTVNGRRLSSAVVAGILGNARVELPSFNPRAASSSGDGGTAHGQFQWRDERVSNFQRIIGVHPRDATPAQSAQFVIWELNNPRAAGMTVAQRDSILDARTPEEAARRFDDHFERSDGTHRNRREHAARQYYGGRPAGPESQQRPQQHDLNTALARLDAMNLPFDLEQRTRREIISRISLNEQLLTRDRERAQDEAWATVERLGDGFTSVNQIPAAVRARLTPQQRLQFDAVGERNQRGSHTTNWGVYAQLSDEYARDPAAFARRNPAELRANLADGEFETVMGWRRDAQQNGGRSRSDTQVTHSRIQSVTDPLLLAAGIVRPPDPPGSTQRNADADRAYYQRVGQFQRRVQEDVARWRAAHPNQQISDDGIRDIADRQLLTLWRDNGQGGRDEVRMFESGADRRGWRYEMPNEDRARIIAAYRRRWGRPPTDQEIDHIYRNGPRGGR